MILFVVVVKSLVARLFVFDDAKLLLRRGGGGGFWCFCSFCCELLCFLSFLLFFDEINQ